MEAFSYDAWDRLLAEVVAEDGKVDYERLAARRPLLKEFVAGLGAASPDSRPDLFLREEDGLGVLDQRLQRVHPGRDRRRVPDPVRLEDARRPVLPAAAARRRRFSGQPRRHRARDPPVGLRRTAHPLRDQLRREWLPGVPPDCLPGRRPPRHAAPGDRGVPGESLELPRGSRGAQDLRLPNLPHVRGGLRRRCGNA